MLLRILPTTSSYLPPIPRRRNWQKPPRGVCNNIALPLSAAPHAQRQRSIVWKFWRGRERGTYPNGQPPLIRGSEGVPRLPSLLPSFTNRHTHAMDHANLTSFHARLSRFKKEWRVVDHPGFSGSSLPASTPNTSIQTWLLRRRLPTMSAPSSSTSRPSSPQGSSLEACLQKRRHLCGCRRAGNLRPGSH